MREVSLKPSLGVYQRLERLGRSRLQRVLERSGYSRAPCAPQIVDELDAEFTALYEHAAPFTMTSRERMYALWQSVRFVAGLPGDVVECGVWRGGSSILAALTLAAAGDERTVWMYDTFDGMSEPGEHDIDLWGTEVSTEWDRHVADDGLYLARASLPDVMANLNAAGVDHGQIRVVAGKVEDTIPGDAPERISVLRLDTDWCASTKHELQHLWPRLVPGGVLIVDDYGHWQGARRAVDEFFGGRDDAPMLTRIDYTGRLGIKLKHGQDAGLASAEPPATRQ